MVSERALKWALRLYPPLLFQRIWVIAIHKDFCGADVKLIKSFLNTNYNNSIFGGTIFAAADPFFPVILHQALAKKGYKARVWVKSAQIQYLKPGRTNLYFTVKISDDDITEFEQVLHTVGVYSKIFPVELCNKMGELCAVVQSEVYMRNLNYQETNNTNADEIDG